MSTPGSTTSAQPSRSVLKTEGDIDREPPLATSAMNKGVQIAEPETSAPAPEEVSLMKKQYSAGIARRLNGRSPLFKPSSRPSAVSQGSVLEGLSLTASPSVIPEDHHRQHGDHASKRILTQVSEWLQHELEKKTSRTKAAVRHRRKSPHGSQENGMTGSSSKPRASSIDSNSSEVSFHRLQRILEDGMTALGLSSIPKLSSKFGHKSGKRSLRHSNNVFSRAFSSDTEYIDGDVVVPSCDAFLDNSKTLGQGLKAPGLHPVTSRREEKERQAWISFKNEVVRLAHTLRLKGWRHVPLDSGESISVERLSGALTNAVYVVSPPANLVTDSGLRRKGPGKVLLRVYGPQVEHLIDRENELGVMRRLARKKIGPRLLGTFLNGRFEEYFDAIALTPALLREPETSKQIAKRMRELHDGVELLEEEKDAGPNVWSNWDRWLDQVEKTMLFLDQRVLSGTVGPSRGPGDSWKSCGLICGVQWAEFKAMVEKYRNFLGQHYGESRALREQLVFAHNDTQYGNILRVRPNDQRSPLLQPANEHKQLIVIDFEYAAANVPGLEFVNHFSEWTYDYHHPTAPWSCDVTRYPTVEEQRRFIKAYVDHRPRLSYSSQPETGTDTTTGLPPLETPPTSALGGEGGMLLRSTSPTNSIREFMLDGRMPPDAYREEERRREEDSERRIAELMQETKLWRVANSAQWVAWGIVQAKVPGLAEVKEDEGEEEAASDEFDYLAYAHERATFFWGDCVLMGLVKLEDLPDSLRERIKLVEY